MISEVNHFHTILVPFLFTTESYSGMTTSGKGEVKLLEAFLMPVFRIARLFTSMLLYFTGIQKATFHVAKLSGI